ncbi:glycosyl hydrolases family 15-domain-containing protein [Gaertneriomyces semiglobifer]|nr:glycosyl hydrolases family 15-domain-containing protein [Gaertneriomyces semiglobifer]
MSSSHHHHGHHAHTPLSAKVALDRYYQEVASIILSRQNPATGLIPASVAITTHGDYRDAWVRDNVYSIYCVWGLALAYRRMDDDGGRGYELEHATVKNMRGLLFAMMRQAQKVECFKHTQAVGDALHAKYSTTTGSTVVADHEWGHLQIDATSLFLLALAQMTASGFRIIYTLDEVAFIQNLVFYVERAYRTPDYGLWERGNKVNHGQPELNSSSIGMVVAALQAINGVNLFGARGGSASVIHVLPDEISRNLSTLRIALPRESASKEIDAALLSVIGFPAFAIDDAYIVDYTREDIIEKLGGRYGCKRFLRDGHQTVLEDTSRLHYEPAELKVFEHIESEWPLFFTYLILEGLFRGDMKQVQLFRSKLEPLLVDSAEMGVYSHNNRERRTHEETAPTSAAHSRSRRNSSVHLRKREPHPPPQHMKLVPELYMVPRENVDEERRRPGSQTRVPNENIPLVWAQSLYILGNLIYDDLLSPAELDPLERRFGVTKKRYHSDVVVQVVLVAEDEELQERLKRFGLETQTRQRCEPVRVSPSSALRDAFTVLGANAKLGLTGRPPRPVGTLTTCKLYRCQGRLYAFTPHFMDKEEFYLVSDNDYLVSVFEQELHFVRGNWFEGGRPTMVVELTREMVGGLDEAWMRGGTASSGGGSASGLGSGHNVNGVSTQEERWRSRAASRNLMNFMMSLRSGQVGGVRVRLGRLSEMVNTSCIESLDFLVREGEGWENILRGDQLSMDVGLGRLSISSADGTARSGDRSGRRRVRRRPTAEGSKSPLLTPLTPMNPDFGDTFRLQDPINGPDDSARPPRTLSPVKDEHGSGTVGEEPAGEGAETPPDMLSLVLGDPSQIPGALLHLSQCTHLYDQMELLHYLSTVLPLDHETPMGSLTSLIEEVYLKAMHLRQWSVVRQAAGLLGKMVNWLTANVSDLLIRQRPLTVGFGREEVVIEKPMNPEALKELIYKHCASDIREAPLVQEVLTYLGSFIRGAPHLFEGIMRIRTHFFIIAMREEISRMKSCDEVDAIDYLMQLSPYEMKSLLGQILAAHDACTKPDAINNFSSSSSATPQPWIQDGHGLPPFMQSQSRWRHLGNIHVQASVESAALKLYHIAGDLPTEIVVNAQSAGFAAGNWVKIEVWRDGMEVLPATGITWGRGLNVCVVDPLDGGILERATFDTHISESESEEFVRLIEWLDPGTIVVVAAMDDCAERLTEGARKVCEMLGSRSIREVGYRDSWCLIAQKGAGGDEGDGGGAVEGYRKAEEKCPTEMVRKVMGLEGSRRSSDAGGKERMMLFLPSGGRQLNRRKNDGALNRVPTDFYPIVWRLLSNVEGIVVGQAYLPSNPTVYEKTAQELNFALQVESLLDVIRDPAERQIAVECLMCLQKISERNPEMNLKKGKLDLMRIVRDAVATFWEGWVKEHASETSVDGVNESAAVGASGGEGLGIGEEPSVTSGTLQPPSVATTTTTAPTTGAAGAGGVPSATTIPPPLLTANGNTTGPTTSNSTPQRPAFLGRSLSSRGVSTLTVNTSTTSVTNMEAPSNMGTAEALSFSRNERFARRLFYDLPMERSMEVLAESCVRGVVEVRIGPGF